MSDLETISARDIGQYIYNRAYVLIDVRQPAEYRRQHIKGAVCIPHEYLLDRIRGLHNAVPILYCDRGGLSMQAARELQEQGYRAISVIGGIMACQKKDLESGFRK